MSSHNLRIQPGGYIKLNDNRPRNERYCLVCNAHAVKMNTTLFVSGLLIQILENNSLIRNIVTP